MLARLGLCCILLLPQMAIADFSVGGKLGTGGAGLEGLYHFDENFTLRAAFVSSAFGGTFDVNGNEYDIDLETEYVSVLLEMSPSEGSFYFVGGIVLHNNAIFGDAFIDPLLGVGVGDTIYDLADIDSLTGRLEFDDRIAPYLGLGWRWRDLKPGLSIGAEIGLLYHGRGIVTLEAEGPITNNAQFLQDLNVEQEDLEDFLGIAELLPVIELRIGYRF